MTDRKPLRIARVEEFALTGDGSKFAFKIVTVDGPVIDFELETAELGTLLQFFVSQAAQCARQSRLDEEGVDPASKLYSPIPTEGFGMSTGQTPKTTLLVVRLYTFELAFEIPNKHLAGLADSIRRTATLMSSDPAKPN